MSVSNILETKAILPVDALASWNLPYFNLVVLGKTPLSPYCLLKELKKIEKEMGREDPSPRWSPRVIDLDILAYGNQIVRSERLTIPHPELMYRPFLINLMATLRDDWRYPVPGFVYSQLTLGEILHSHIHFDANECQCFMPFPQLVGIVNITPDSFSDGGKYVDSNDAMQRIKELIDQGASVIDIGAQSTRPKANPITVEEEWNRLEPVLDHIKHEFNNLSVKPRVSLDSFHFEVIRRAFQYYSIDWINDVHGGEDGRIFNILREIECKMVLNHPLKLPFMKGTISQLNKWITMKIKQCETLGITKERIIFDPGIGFGKTSFQSLFLLRNIDLLDTAGCEILVGHSRKSFLNIVTSAANRDLETMGVSQYLMRKVDYLRVHNVLGHQKALTAAALLEGIDEF